MAILVSAVHHLISINVKKLAQTSEHDGSVSEGLFEVIGGVYCSLREFPTNYFKPPNDFEIYNFTKQLDNRIKV